MDYEDKSSTPGRDRDFAVVDYVLFVASLALSMGVGIWAALSGGKNKTTSEYLMGDRNLNPFAVCMSIFMSFVSAILILSNTAEVFLWGFQYWLMGFSAFISFFFIAYLFVPFFYRMNLVSSFEYFENRFSNGNVVRLTADFLQVIYQVLYMGTSMYAPAIALEGAIGFPIWGTILICGAISTAYTTVGGMKAVVWTDALQGIIYFGGVFTILIIGIDRAGGLAQVWDVGQEWGRLKAFDFDPNPMIRLSFWPLVVGGVISFFHTVGCSQTSVQRYCAVPTLKDARMVVLLMGPVYIIMFTVTCGLGLVVFAYYMGVEECDPLRTGSVGNVNTLLVVFLIDVIDIPGLGGLLLSVLFSGALSTNSSAMGGLAAVTWKDILEKRYQDVPEEKKAFITKVISVFYGVLGVAAAFLISNMEGTIAEASTGLVSGIAGPILGMFLLGMFFPYANGIGTTVGAWFGLAMVLFPAMGYYSKAPWVARLDTTIVGCSNVTLSGEPIDFSLTEIPTEHKDIMEWYKLSFLWYAALGTISTVICGAIVSLLTSPMEPEGLNPKYTIPLFDKMCGCLPETMREPCRCGVNYDAEEEEHGGSGQNLKSTRSSGTFTVSGSMPSEGDMIKEMTEEVNGTANHTSGDPTQRQNSRESYRKTDDSLGGYTNASFKL